MQEEDHLNNPQKLLKPIVVILIIPVQSTKRFSAQVPERMIF